MLFKLIILKNIEPKFHFCLNTLREVTNLMRAIYFDDVHLSMVFDVYFYSAVIGC